MNNFENCGYYVDGECNICGMGTDGEDTFCKYCKDNSNCYYKQLKRLEQVNKELVEDNLSLSKENAELKAENERLEFMVQKLSEDLSCSNKCLRNKIDIEHKYRTTLQEIKDYLNTLSGIDNDFVNTETYLRILDCITKAEEE